MRALTLIASVLFLLAGPAGAQEILLDQMVEAGGLKCYPVHGDPTSWYYLPDQPHVATDGSDRPQFSFLMYSSPEQRGEEGITSAPGGGVAHMLFAYNVPEDLVRQAQSELQRQEPGAQLKGPVTYTDGTFNLVTAVTDSEAGLSRRVAGVGNAPVMSGHKAAVSMHLTPSGAMLLWESFSQRTPDISVNFEMTVSGYRNPVEAKMTFDYERIHKTMQFEAGIEASFIEADVDIMLGKMVDNGAINIELKGAPPEQWNDVQKLGLELAKHHLFENLGAAPISQVRELTRSSGSTRRSSLELPLVERIEMVALPPPGEEEARQLDERATRAYRAQQYATALELMEAAEEEVPANSRLYNMAVCHLHLGHRDEALEILQQWQSDTEIEEYRESGAIAEARRQIAAQPERIPVGDRDALATRLSQARRSAAGETDSDTPATTTSVIPTSGGTAEDPFAEGVPDLPPTPIPGARSNTPTPTPRAAQGAQGRTATTTAGRTPTATPRSGSRGRSSQSRARDEGGGSNFSISIAFRYRKIERSGKFAINMKQWNRVEIPVRFAANVGNLSRYIDDSRMFRRVSLNDPMFKQREIPVTVDVASEEAFAAMLNTVTVTLKKQHESGRETLDEVNIHRADFGSGKMESMVYGWDGDDDRDAWLEYDHRVRWSYVGGPVIETDWQSTTAGALVLEPPLRPRELTLEADPVLLREQGVRDVVLEVHYPAGNTERSAHATVKPSDEIGRQTLVLYQDPQHPDYTYSFDWRLYGGRRVEAGPFAETADYIYLDEVPQ